MFCVRLCFGAPPHRGEVKVALNRVSSPYIGTMQSLKSVFDATMGTEVVFPFLDGDFSWLFRVL